MKQVQMNLPFAPVANMTSWEVKNPVVDGSQLAGTCFASTGLLWYTKYTTASTLLRTLHVQAHYGDKQTRRGCPSGAYRPWRVRSE